MADKTIRTASMCWTCVHGRFDRRNTIGAVRYSGTCVEATVGEDSISSGYKPPKAFSADLRDGAFKTKFKEFLEENATVYWPHRVSMDENVKGRNVRYLSEERLEREFKSMLWLHDNDGLIDEVAWSDVCDQYEDGKE